MSIQYGEWRIIQAIGSGAFGTVYEIRRETLGFVQSAALKVISIPQSQNDVDAMRSTGMDEASIGEYYKELASQIMNELRTMEQLKGHTNIVSYEDHEIRKKETGIGWDLYIRMELLTPLSKYVLMHSMSREDIIRLGIDLCHALERCESLNIIHRDIKPDNIFLTKMGDAKLGDFGIARTVERTMSGLSQKGTYGYMAPEVYLGQPYGKSVDIYSLGLVLYKLLNYNRGPFLPDYPNPIRFQDQEQALVRRIKGERFPAPAQADRRLAEVVLKACSAEPGQRYATAQDMLRALQTARQQDAATPRSGGRALSENYAQSARQPESNAVQLAQGKCKKKRSKKWIVPVLVMVIAHSAIGVLRDRMDTNNNESLLDRLKQPDIIDYSDLDFFYVSLSEDHLYLRLNESKTIYITATCADDDTEFYIEREYDPEYFDVEWGEWDGDILPVTIKVIKSGNYVRQIVFSASRYDGDPLAQKRTVMISTSS